MLKTAPPVMPLDAARARWRSVWYADGFFRPLTLAQALEQSVARAPDTLLVFHSDTGLREVRVGELWAQSAALARGLAQRGLRAGEVFALQLPTRYETALLYLAALRVGAVLLPIVHTYGPRELDFILRDSRAAWFATLDRWRGTHYLDQLTKVPAAAQLKQLVIVGEASRPGAIGLAELEQSAASANAPTSTLEQSDADALAVLLYTSGTTGNPKGVRHTHNTVRAEWESPFFANKGPYITPFPAGHIAGFNFLLRPIVAGIPMVYLERWEAEVAAELIERYRVTQTGGTPYFLQTLLDAAQHTRRDLTSIRHYSLGATGVTREHVKLTDDLGWNGGRSYGLTEHSTVSMTWPDMPFEQRANTDGRIQPGTRVRIVDEAGRDVVAGSEGEIWTQGPELCAGYTDPQLDNDAFSVDGWFKTGDIGRADANNGLTITDRKKDIIIRGGENIASREVEQVLALHAAVADVAVVAVPDALLGERICAWIVPRGQDADNAITLERLAAHCEAQGLARFKSPERIRIVSELPRNAAGKVRKEVLRDRLRDESVARVRTSTP